MCFSTEASFSAGIILAVSGAVALKKVNHSSQIMFASMPLLFSIQQFTEGFVWITLTHPEYAHLQNIPIHIFMFFAQTLWPLWVPISLYFIEKNQARKKIFLLLIGAGLLLSGYHFYRAIYYEIHVSITPNHIAYRLDFNLIQKTILAISYFSLTIIAPFISSIKRMPYLGILIFCSFLISKIFFTDSFISVWCFFAAIISVVVVLIINKMNTKFLGVGRELRQR